MALRQSIKLLSGYECPLVGYGTYLSSDPAQLKTGIKAAVQAGYRHIDTAHIYRNEEVIGEALQELYDKNVVKREEMFLTTKLFPTHFRPQLVEPMLRKQLAKLKTTYLDLYLMHLPVSMKPLAEGDYPASMGALEVDMENRLENTWGALEKCVEAGLVRSIGVSNFSIGNIDQVLNLGTTKPAVNQVELNPLFQNKKLVKHCQANGVVIMAHSQFSRPGVISPLTGKPMYEGNLLEDSRLMSIATKHGKTTAQVILRWLAQHGICSIPKSLTPERISSNNKIWDFELSNDEMEAIGAIDTNKRQSIFPGIDKHPDFDMASDGSSC